MRWGQMGRKAVAGFMALWLSGLVFLLCCHVQSLAATIETCPLVKLGAHCDMAEKEAATERISSQSDKSGMDCCAFIPTLFEKTRANTVEQTVAPVTLKLAIERPTLLVLRSNFTPVILHVPLRLLRNDTFLKNRTFRI